MRFFKRIICAFRDHQVSLKEKGRVQVCKRCNALVDCCARHGHDFHFSEDGSRRICSRCDTEYERCLGCNGRGWTDNWIQGSDCMGEGSTKEPCQNCEGRGHQNGDVCGCCDDDCKTERICKSCHGKGGHNETCRHCQGWGWLGTDPAKNLVFQPHETALPKALMTFAVVVAMEAVVLMITAEALRYFYPETFPLNQSSQQIGLYECGQMAVMILVSLVVPATVGLVVFVRERLK